MGYNRGKKIMNEMYFPKKNILVINGNICGEVVSHQTDKGESKRFTIAHNTPKDEAIFITVIVLGNAENSVSGKIETDLAKGKNVTVEGRLNKIEAVVKDGKTYLNTEVVANKVYATEGVPQNVQNAEVNGRLVADPKTFNGEKGTCTILTIAHNEGADKPARYWDVKLFGNSNNSIESRLEGITLAGLKKGALITAYGPMTRETNEKDGVTYVHDVIIANKVSGASASEASTADDDMPY